MRDRYAFLVSQNMRLNHTTNLYPSTDHSSNLGMPGHGGASSGVATLSYI